MRIKVKPIGLIKTFLLEQEVHVPEEFTPRALLARFPIPDGLKMMAFVNGKSKDLDSSLQDGDEIHLVTIVTGG